MSGAWYWYVEDCDYGNNVRMHIEKKDAVRGHWWVVPARIKVRDGVEHHEYHYEDWRLYLQPKWYADYHQTGKARSPDKIDQTLNCEWVVVKREPAPVYTRTMRGVNTCKTCGHEETVWEVARES